MQLELTPSHIETLRMVLRGAVLETEQAARDARKSGTEYGDHQADLLDEWAGECSDIEKLVTEALEKAGIVEPPYVSGDD